MSDVVHWLTVYHAGGSPFVVPRRFCSAAICVLVSSNLCLVVFFFQAEDGIRDYKVTGVQTCALPIFWLQPFYTSPNRDNGYDVSDYYGVGERFGSSGDYVEFMNQAHSLGMRVIVDLVVRSEERRVGKEWRSRWSSGAWRKIDG